MAAPGTTNGHGATIATLETKVTALEGGQARIERTILDLDSTFNTSITSLQADFRNQLNALTNKLDQGRTPLVAIISTAIAGFVATTALLGGIGALVYGPIQRDTQRLDTAVAAILDRGVFQREYTADELRTKDELRNLRVDLSTRITLPRYTADQERVVHSLDEIRNRFASKTEMEAVFKERQRQIDIDTSQIESLRTRTYDHFGRITKTEQAVIDLDRRFDNLSRRVIELNSRTMGIRPPPN